MWLKRLMAWGLVASVLLTACAPTAATAPKRKFRFAYDYWAGYYPVLIAIEKGYFAEEGLEVEAVRPENTDALMADMLAGNYDMAAVSLGDLVSLTQINPNIRFIIASDFSNGADAVVLGKGFTSVADLKGHKLGVNLGGFAELMVNTMLETNGLTTKDVELVDTDAAQIPAELRSGNIQAGETWEPYVSEAVQDGGKVGFTSADTPGLILDGLAVLQSTVDSRRSDLAGFARAWFKAVDYWNANPDAGDAAAATQLKVNVSEVSLTGIRLLNQADNRKLFTPGVTTESAYYTAKVYIDFFTQRGLMSVQPDPNKLLYSEFVK